MKILRQFVSQIRAIGTQASRYAAFITLLLSIVPLVGHAAITAAPAVAQQPLILQPQIPPNIMLMLDDSGSMNWDIMPDWGYLPAPNWSTISNNWNGLSDASVLPLIDSGINGVYYNPTVTYVPPSQANGTPYPTASFNHALVNGFNSGSQVVDLSLYRGRYDSNDTSYEASSVQYSIVMPTSQVGTAAPNACPVNGSSSTKYPGYCYYSSAPSNSFLFFDTTNHAFYTSKCSGVNNVYNSNSNTCLPGISFFTYATTDSSGSLIRHYVGENSGDCAAAGLTGNCVDISDTSGIAAPSGVTAGTNIANWFSYYHTRILAAKSGLMSGFQNMPQSYRFGFGSINNSNASALPGRIQSGNNQLAPVQVFGDGTAGTQKANFWSWVAGINPSGSTPLPAALQSVGMYYQTQQPWQSMTGDPGYSVSGTNMPLACRASYAILTTDGFWNGSVPNVGNVDGTDGPSQNGPNGQTYSNVATPPYSDSYSNTLADVAAYYWKNDLQDGSGSSYDLANEVPVSAEDPAFWQHMTTFTVGMGFDPVNISPSGTTVDQIFNWANGGTPINSFSWPQPAADSVNNIADLAHAALNGHGAFFSVKNPQAFESGIGAAIKRVTERVGTGASLAANSTQLDTGTVVYQANYFTAKWKGDLKALPVNPVNGIIGTTPNWQASAQMPDAANRNIWTWNGTGFVAFQNDSTGAPPPTLSAALSAPAAALGSSVSALINYLRGDKSKEQSNGGPFRSRDTALGDIVNSQPVYVGVPSPNEFSNQSFYGTTVDPVTNSVPFLSWAVGTTDASGNAIPSAASERSPMIYVAANDGMLHGFDAATGVEKFAYLPGAVITAGIASLADPNYGGSSDPHQFFNDGQLTVADAYVKLAADASPQWHTILVGTTGRGTAEAVYALDVTDPTNITPLWERSAGDGKPGSTYIGQMAGKPVIAQTNATTSSSTWSVLMGNGYNSTAGVSALLQFNLATGDLSVHATADATTGNGLAAPVTWMDAPSTGVSDVAYAGDLHGQVWAFKLNDTTGANSTPTSTGVLMFTAKDGSGNVQPITAGMLAGINSKTGDVWLFFGTGRYLASTDLTDVSTQTWYGIIVQSSANAQLVSNLSQGRGDLVQRTITAEIAGGPNGKPLPSRTVSAPTANDMTGKSGWYLDLVSPSASGITQKGERMVDVNQFQGSLLVGVTRVPQVADVCNPSGSGWIMALDAFTGTAPSSNFFDVNRDGYIDASDSVNGSVVAGLMFGASPNAPIFVSNVMEVSFDNGTTASIGTAATAGTTQRVDWRELIAQ